MKDIAKLISLCGYGIFIGLGLISIGITPTLNIIRLFMIGIVLHKLGGLGYAVLNEIDQQRFRKEIMNAREKRAQEERINELYPNNN